MFSLTVTNVLLECIFNMLNCFAFKLVESILTKKPGGESIINQYNESKSLTDETRRKMVNILAADMTEKNVQFVNSF